MNNAATDPNSITQPEMAADDSAWADNGEFEDGPFEDKRGHKGTERKCIVAGVVKPRAEMIRFVRDPSDVVTPDITGKLPGRGVWVSADRGSLETAVKTKAFSRGFKGKAVIPDGLVDMVQALLARRLLGLITMARKSGHITIGYDQVKGAAAVGNLAWRIEARDGSEDGRSKIRTLSKAVARELELPLAKLCGCFTNAELADALSRESVVHIGLPRGPLAKSFARDAARYAGFVPMLPDEWPDIDHERHYER